MSEATTKNLHWVSVLMRLSIGSLMLVAALNKVPNGIEGTVGYFTSVFEKSLLPLFLVKIYAASIMVVEFLAAAWLLSGYKLKAAWIFNGLLLVSLAVGMALVGKYDVASNNYAYVVIAGIGLLASSYDRWQLGSSRL